MISASLLLFVSSGAAVCLAQSGRVLMESGSPPGRATVEKFCGGKAAERVETDGEGLFRFPEGGETRGCTLHARAGGLRSNEIRLDRVPDGLVGTLIVHPAINTSRSTVSLRSLAVPDNARAAYARGMQEGRRNRLDKARGHFEKAVRLHPPYAEAWLRLGFVFERMGLKTEASNAFRRAAEADPESVPANMRSALAAAERQDWDAVRRHTDRVIAVRPRRSVMAYYYNALANVALNRIDAAEESLNIARELDPERTLTKLHLIAATIHEHRGNLAAAIASYRRYLELSPDGPESPQLQARVAHLERQSAPR